MYKLDLHFPFLTVGSKAAPLAQVCRLIGASDNLFGSRCDDFLAPVWFSPGDLPRKSGFCCLQWRRSRPLFHTCARNTLNLRRRVPGWKGRSFSAYLSCHPRLAPNLTFMDKNAIFCSRNVTLVRPMSKMSLNCSRGVIYLTRVGLALRARRGSFVRKWKLKFLVADKNSINRTQLETQSLVHRVGTGRMKRG